MKRILKITFTIALLGFTATSSAQIIINGNNPNRRYAHKSASEIPSNAVSISYASVFWEDGKNVPLQGHSITLDDSELYDGFSVEQWNFAVGVQVAYDKKITDRFLVNLAFSTARMVTGTSLRLDLDATEKSRFSQLGIYASWSLTKNLDHRFQFQWLAGPEVIYANKRVTISDYVTEDKPEPATYYQNLNILEVSAVTGLGISLRVFGNCNLYSNVLGGKSFPGNGLKLTNTGLGLKIGF
jgi:hypothetical protein